MMENYYVYVLQSLKDKTFYAGQTRNLLKRLEEHNSVNARYTKKGQPWNIIWSKEETCRKDAIILERKIKKRGIRRCLLDNNVLEE